MKLSQMDTERAADVLCEITPYIANITGDKALLDELAQKIGANGISVAELYVFAAKKYAALAPVVLKDHREDVFGILAVLNETTVEKISKQNIIITMTQIREVVKDKELVDFFRSWRDGDKTE